MNEADLRAYRVWKPQPQAPTTEQPLILVKLGLMTFRILSSMLVAHVVAFTVCYMGSLRPVCLIAGAVTIWVIVDDYWYAEGDVVSETLSELWSQLHESFARMMVVFFWIVGLWNLPAEPAKNA